MKNITILFIRKNKKNFFFPRAAYTFQGWPYRHAIYFWKSFVKCRVYTLLFSHSDPYTTIVYAARVFGDVYMYSYVVCVCTVCYVCSFALCNSMVFFFTLFGQYVRTKRGREDLVIMRHGEWPLSAHDIAVTHFYNVFHDKMFCNILINVYTRRITDEDGDVVWCRQ